LLSKWSWKKTISEKELNMKKTVTWILIADGSRARLIANQRSAEGYKQVIDTDFIADKRSTHDLGSERPGRTHDSTGEARHAMQSPTDAHREEKRHLAQRVSDFLEEQRRQKAFERLIVIAAPQALGDLRNNFSSSLQNMVVEEINKDLTMFSLHELQAKLPALIKITH
jgi:protein required for attachment to host cells